MLNLTHPLTKLFILAGIVVGVTLERYGLKTEAVWLNLAVNALWLFRG